MGWYQRRVHGTDDSPEPVSEKGSKDERDIWEDEKQAEEIQSVVENHSGEELNKNNAEEETSVKEEEDIVAPEDSAEPVMEDVPLENPEHIAELPKTPEPSQEEVCETKAEESKCNIPADPSVEVETIPRTASSRSMPRTT